MAFSSLPNLPASMDGFVPYLTANRKKPMIELLEPYKKFEGKLREIYAQEPENPILKDGLINTVPLFAGHERDIKTRARNLSTETEDQMSKYIMPLPDDKRHANKSSAVVRSLKDFQYNFNVFSESSLSEMNWDNVVAAGSSVLTPLLPIPKGHGSSKRALRNYYHSVFAPASDVDLFLYGLTQEQALQKIVEIERCVNDSILADTTTVRTKNAITIVSKYPVRHVQIVLRIYKSISEILTGFDVDCSCVAYDGKQVYATPRAVSSLITQINHVDLSRRSPSYENRLSKYSHRGFEVFWPHLERARIDPTIFERSFPRTVGLARLLVFEKLPSGRDRAHYENKRREERGRPLKPQGFIYRNPLRGNIKAGYEDEVAEWVEEDNISNYHTFTIPYGEKFHAKKIEKLLYTKDLLLNAEWNKKERDVNLHRHPAFFGDAKDVFEDCCEFCPEAKDEHERQVQEEESKQYVSGKVSFITDDPGRQAIGSFNPITDTDWCEMAYVGNTERLCQSIVDCDLDAVTKSLEEGIDPNRRDYTGRTPLQLAVMTSSPEIVKCLLDHGAYLVPRMVDGQSVLHLAAVRGDKAILDFIYERNKINMDSAVVAQGETNKIPKVGKIKPETSDSHTASEIGSEDSEESEEGFEATGLGSSGFIKVESLKKYLEHGDQKMENEPSERKIEPKDDVLDPDIPAWDTGLTPHHLATVFGNLDSLEILLKKFGADPNIPVKICDLRDHSRRAILSLALALTLSPSEADEIVKVLVSAGAKSSLADMKNLTVLNYFVNHSDEMLDILVKHDEGHAKAVANYVFFNYDFYIGYRNPLSTAIENRDVAVVQKLLNLGADYEISFESWRASQDKKQAQDHEVLRQRYFKNIIQPIHLAINCEIPEVVQILLEAGADVNTCNPGGSLTLNGYREPGVMPRLEQTVLDRVRAKIKDLKDQLSIGEIPEPECPDFSQHLEGVEKDSYQHWCISRSIAEQKQAYQLDLKLSKKHQSLSENFEDHPFQRKIAAIQDLIDQFERLAEHLVERGAKPFVELCLKVEPIDDEMAELENRLAALNKENNKKLAAEMYKVTKVTKNSRLELTFSAPRMTEVRRTQYIDLFEAAWVGDLDTIKKLTTVSMGEDQNEPPLTITATDKFDLAPFEIAFLRGHMDCAWAILDITQAQYQPDRKQEKSYYIGQDINDGYDSDSNNSKILCIEADFPLYSCLPASVRNQFTKEVMAETSSLVNSNVSPNNALRRTLPLSTMRQIADLNADNLHFGDFGLTDTDEYPTIPTVAVLNDDFALWTKIIDADMKYHKFNMVLQKKDGMDALYRLPNSCFDLAIRLGRTRFVADMAKRTGEGLPLSTMIEGKGLEVEEKSEYYQGLSIRGKKNKEWATMNNRSRWSASYRTILPPLLTACGTCSIESVEWLLSDAPLRVYSEFGASRQDDERVKALQEVEGGFDYIVNEWLDADHDIALHHAITATDIPESKRLAMVSYLIRAIPGSLNAKDSNGLTPLHIAYTLRNVPIAKMLLHAGADAFVRDTSGDTIIHALFTYNGQHSPHRGLCVDHERMAPLLDLLPRESVERLVTKRNWYHSGAQTPLHAWLAGMPSNGRPQRNTHGSCIPSHQHCCKVATLELLLAYSPDVDALLGEIDGSGQSAVHMVAAEPDADLLRAMIARSPALLHRENAVGRTPLEVARDAWLKDIVKHPPTIGDISRGWNWHEKKPVGKSTLTGRRSEDWLVGYECWNLVAEAWKICREAADLAERPAKRRLVSLAEASEVMERLSAMAGGTEWRMRSLAGSETDLSASVVSLGLDSSAGGEDLEEGEELGDREARNERDWKPDARVSIPRLSGRKGELDGETSGVVCPPVRMCEPTRGYYSHLQDMWVRV